MDVTKVQNPTLPFAGQLPEDSMKKVVRIETDGKSQDTDENEGFAIALGDKGTDLYNPTIPTPLIFEVDYCKAVASLKTFDNERGLQVFKTAPLDQYPTLQRGTAGFKIFLSIGEESVDVDVENKHFCVDYPLPCSLGKATHFFIDNNRSGGALSIPLITYYTSAGPRDKGRGVGRTVKQK